MIYKPFWVILIFHLSILFISPISYSQFGWRLNGEAGLFESSGTGILKNEDLLTRFDGSLKYIYDYDRRNAALSLHVRPEFYNFDNPVYSIKLKAEGEYYQSEEKFNWGLNLTRQINFYNYSPDDLTYDVFALTGNMSWFFLDDLPVSANLGYAYQVIKNREEYNLDLLFIDFKFFKQISSNLKFGYGLYLERFFINNEIISGFRELNIENDGWRYGPQISISYLKDFIINILYKFLVQDSKFTKNFSNEHLIRLVAGKIFLTDWSAFLLVDYNTLSLKKTGDYIEGVTPLYTPLNLENRIYVKLAYEISDNAEIYTRSGYFKDNLYEDRLSIEGWNVMIGIELNGGMK